MQLRYIQAEFSKEVKLRCFYIKYSACGILAPVFINKYSYFSFDLKLLKINSINSKLVFGSKNQANDGCK